MTTLDVAEEETGALREETAAKEIVRLPREHGLSLTGSDRLLRQFTKSVLETTPNEDMTERLGMPAPHPGGPGLLQHPQRNGFGPSVPKPPGSWRSTLPRERDGSFNPQVADVCGNPGYRSSCRCMLRG